jgi:Putative prokaryotic signal transducing protein
MGRGDEKLFCPRCGAEYREGFVECSDCGVALVREPPPEVPHPDVELDTVFESTNPALLAVAKSLLEDAGIEYESRGDSQFAVLPVLPVRIEVDRARLDEARALLSRLDSTDEDSGPEDPDDDDGNG